MCSFVCGVTTVVIGAVLVATTGFVGYGVVPGIIQNIIENEVILLNDTIQFERFEEVPFPLNFSVTIWNISNAAEVLDGAVPIVSEIGPYVYKLYQTRVLESVNDDNLTYRFLEHFEFDAEVSFPLTEDDTVTIANVAFNAILQVAESLFPFLMPALNLGLNGVFDQNNSPVMTVRVRDLLFDGIRLCTNPGFIASIACNQVRQIGANAQNLEELDDGSLSFSLLSYRNGNPSQEYVVDRGLQDSAELARILLFNQLTQLTYWPDDSECNMIKGTDSGIFAPFIDRTSSLYALNTDVCRSVELRYQQDIEYEGIPSVRFSANEWFLNNDEGCFCLNVTAGINRENGCLLPGAMELYSCVGAFLVLSYPHFLYADPLYMNGVLGVNPIEEEHRIFVDLEPNTGTVVRGRKRGQFNIFLRPVGGITATQSLRTTLTPVFWIEEGMDLPAVYVDEIKNRLLAPLNLVDIIIPIVLALFCVVFAIGVLFTVRAKLRKSNSLITPSNPTPKVDG